MANSKKSTFESQLEELEGVVNRLEVGDLSLDDSLTQFEVGVKLTKDCQKMLNEAQQKVQILSDNEQKLETFD
ncbi:MAG: exodeoxyribonuclease VII small subunit [Enterobacterales bacterium]|nr:exodeoxyribonuclease VII small subunit [Enterobacterales bacterium]